MTTTPNALLARRSGLDVTVQHRYYATGDLVRVLVSITNPGTEPITARTGTDNGAGSDDQIEFLATSSGDAALTVADDWMVTSDGYETDPVLSSVWQGAGGAVRADEIGQYGVDGPVDNFYTGAPITVAPGATAYLAYFTKIYGYQGALEYEEGVGATTFVGADIAAAEAAALAGITEWATLSGRLAVGIPAGASVLNWAPAAADPATPVVARPAFTG